VSSSNRQIPADRDQPWIAVGAEVTSVLSRVQPVSVARLRAQLENPRSRCFFTGQGRSGFVAQMGAMRLVQLGKRAHAVGEATAPSFAKEDVLVVVSASGTTPTSLLYTQQAHDLGGAVCCLTAHPQSPIALLSDPCVIVPVEDSLQLGGVLFTQAALLLLDGIVLALSGGDNALMRRNHANLQ